jgi:hypothetical protein
MHKGGNAASAARFLWLFLLGVFVFGFGPAPAMAQTDEIQVYDGEIAPVGIFNLTWHNNYTPTGRKDPAFEGGLVPNHTYNSTTEWAYGVTPWFEQGLYLPLFSDSSNQGWVYNGWKLRELFAEPDAANKMFVYAVNFEFSFNQKHWEDTKYSSEIRPIIGWHLGDWDIILNPIIDNSYKGFKNLDFAPSERVAYNFSKTWAVAAELYSDFGVIHRFSPWRETSQQLFATADYGGDPVNIEAGIGFGLTPGSDKLVLKLMFSRDLN